MRQSNKPFRTITYYSGAEGLKKKLNEIGVKYTFKDVKNEFWGVEFQIEKPTGKGATKKMQLIREL